MVHLFFMPDDINLPLILLAAFVAATSPGPATLTIAGTSMASGRRYGLAVASGVTTGSMMWSVAAALGLGAIMLSYAWTFEIIRYLGAGYLLYLAFKSARFAFSPAKLAPQSMAAASSRAAYGKGLALHLTNPKAILFFGSLFAVGVPADASFRSLAIIICAVGVQNLIVFHGYALIFSNRSMMSHYIRLRRWFEATFAIAFGAAGLKILTTRLN